MNTFVRIEREVVETAKCVEVWWLNKNGNKRQTFQLSYRRHSMEIEEGKGRGSFLGIKTE